MTQTIRVSLPGYDALSDTNLDHYSLYADEDNVLIKRFSTGSGNLPSVPPSPQTLTVNHGLSYIPFFMTYFDQYADGNWYVMNNQWNLFTVPNNVCGMDSSNLTIYNFQARSVPYAYDIFYDDMSQTGSPTITESSEVVKVTRPGKDTSSKNPNDYIMHSDLNNFKIIKQGSASVTIPSTSPWSVSFAHGANVNTPYKYFCFVKFPDGKTLLTGNAAQSSYDESASYIYSSMNSTDITIGATVASNTNVTVYYIIYGTGKDNTVSNSNEIIAVTKSGKDVLTATNPDDFNFHSDYPTLKYYNSGSYSMTVSNTTVHTIAHNLGYVPFFAGFVNDLAAHIGSNVYTIMPYYWSRSSISTPNNDIAAFIYADSSNIYLKAYYQPNAVGTSLTFTFYYKIFKNNLGL